MAVSPKAINGFKLHPFCIRNGVLKPRINVGAFQASFYDVSRSAYSDYFKGAATPYTNDNGDFDRGTSVVAVVSGDSVNDVAGKIRAATAQFPNWTVTGADDTVIFTCKTVGAKTTPTLSTAQGVTSSWAVTVAGDDSTEAVYTLTITGGATTTGNITVNIDGFSGFAPDITAITGDKLASVAGYFPLVRYTRAAFRTLAANRGSNWTQLDYLTRDAVNLLYTVEFANLNGQAALGQGVCSKTWNGTFKAEKSGLAAYSLEYPSYGITTDGLHPVCFRGIENWWGNVWQWVDGINIKAGRNPWIADSGYADDKFEPPYWDTGITLGDTTGYISNIHDTPDWAFLPSSVAGGGETKYFCDYYYQATGNRVVYVGGYWTYGGLPGPFTLGANYSSGNPYITVGGRLQCS